MYSRLQKRRSLFKFALEILLPPALILGLVALKSIITLTHNTGCSSAFWPVGNCTASGNTCLEDHDCPKQKNGQPNTCDISCTPLRETFWQLDQLAWPFGPDRPDNVRANAFNDYYDLLNLQGSSFLNHGGANAFVQCDLKFLASSKSSDALEKLKDIPQGTLAAMADYLAFKCVAKYPKNGKEMVACFRKECPDAKGKGTTPKDIQSACDDVDDILDIFAQTIAMCQQLNVVVTHAAGAGCGLRGAASVSRRERT